MSHDLHQVLRAALIKGVIAYLKTFEHLHPYVSRIEHLADDEELDFVSHSSVHGISWKIVVSKPDSEHPLDDMLFIPLDPMLHKTFYLLTLYREVGKVESGVSLVDFPQTLRGAAYELRRGLQRDADFWGEPRGCPIPFNVDFLKGDAAIAFFLRYIGGLLKSYIEETLAK